MKAYKVVLSVVLTTFLTIPALGQYEPTETMQKQDAAKKGMPAMKPAYETTVEGTHLKVWVMTEMEHEKMMKSQTQNEKTDMDKSDPNSKPDAKDMDKDNDKAMKTKGTHHLKIEATDESTGAFAKELAGTVDVTSPSMKMASVELKPAMNHAGCDVMLNEKGQYQFSLNLKVDGNVRTAKFDYTPVASQAMNEDDQ
jgi:hypothetical protein